MIEIIVGCIAGAAIVGLRRLGVAGRRRWMSRHPAPTFLFADLVGYTTLTDRRGDHTAAWVAQEFWRTMSALSREHGARQVKSMGDGAMIWVPDPTEAVTLAARVVEEIGSRTDLLPVRVGAHTGPAVMRCGDWYGSVVNIAARLAREAEPNQALISSATWRAARGDLRQPVAARRELALRGVERPVVALALAPG
jgi:adenylate cyclase